MNTGMNIKKKRFTPMWSLTISLAVYLLLLLPTFSGISFVLPEEHFYIVSLTSLIAAGISYGMGVSGIRLRNLQVLFVALGFISLTIFFTLHGLSTPGFLLEFNPVVSVSVQMSFLLLSFFLWLSTVPGNNKFISSLGSNNRLLLGGWTLLLIALSVLFFFRNELILWIPLDSAPLNWIVALTTLFLSLIAGFRFWRAYQYTQFSLQAGLAHATALISAAQVIASTGELWHISWWLYHFLLLGAVLITVFTLISQFSFGDTLGLALQGLFTDSPTERIMAGISPKIKALIVAEEAHDLYTAGHAQRVALNAIRLGEKVGLSPDELRALAHGSLLHDIGKISVPNEILNKPGTLTPDERHEMEKHTLYGYEMCQKLGFMDAELEIIRWHHERVNGRGYPDVLTVDKIPALVKIVAVVDIYDALTSDRAYRKALSHDQAIQHLDAFSNFALDKEYVELWKALIGAEFEN
jgi:putative nucleotidyltransferase with HDIG domain